MWHSASQQVYTPGYSSLAENQSSSALGRFRQLQKGNLLVTVWHDKRQVAVLSTNFQPDQTVTVQRRTKQPPHTKDVDIPEPIRTYNQYMGGVDLSDQMRSYYPSGRPGKKWWRYLLWYLLDVSICNAFVLKRISPQAVTCCQRTLLHFRLELVKQLIGGFYGRKRYTGKKRNSLPQDGAVALSNLPGHQEVQFEGGKRVCVNCSNHARKTPACRTPTTTYGLDIIILCNFSLRQISPNRSLLGFTTKNPQQHCSFEHEC